MYVPESELSRVQAVVTARLPQNWQYVSHKRVPQRAGEFLQRSLLYVNSSQLMNSANLASGSLSFAFVLLWTREVFALIIVRY